MVGDGDEETKRLCLRKESEEECVGVQEEELG